MQRLKARRRLWLVLHLYLGLVAGIILVITGLTGSVIAFGGDIDAWVNADRMKIPRGDATQPRQPIERTFAIARAALPPQATLLYINIPRDPERANSVLYSLPSAEEGGADEYELYVNPYRGSITGQRLVDKAGHPFSAPIMSLIVDLHYRLWLGSSGMVLVGVVSVGLLFSVATGLIVWWPLTNKWRQAFTLRRGSAGARFNYDLHKTCGVYSSLLLLVVLFSGIYLNLPEQVTSLVQIFSPAPGWPEDVRSDLCPHCVPIAVGEAVSVADRLFRDGELMGIALPQGPEGVYVIRKRAPDEVTRAYPHRQVWLDQYSGRVLAVNDPHAYTAGQRFLEWQYPLHSGEAFGLPGRMVICIIGILCPLLYITGFVRWRQKARSKRHHLASAHRTRE